MRVVPVHLRPPNLLASSNFPECCRDRKHPSSLWTNNEINAGRAILASTAVEESLRVVCRQGREESVPLAGGELQAFLVGEEEEGEDGGGREEGGDGGD